MRPGTPQRILIIRLSAIGDVIMATSILPGLHTRWPDARITWLTEGLGAEILEGNPLVDEVLVLPRKDWRKLRKQGHWFALARSIRRFQDQLRRRSFDLAIDLQGLLKSALWARLSGAPRRVILRPREKAQWLMTESVADPEGFGGPICREYRHISSHLGLPSESFEMSVHPLPDRVESIAARIAAHPGRPVALLPFTTRPQKHWFESCWSELADRLAAIPDIQVWILGGPTDTPSAERIAAHSRVPPVCLSGPDTDLRDKAAFLAQASLAIGVDTGLTHLALGLRCPTVALFGSTCPYRDTSPVPGVVLYDQLDCSPCRRHPTCQGAFTCMRNHTVDKVAAAARRLLES